MRWAFRVLPPAGAAAAAPRAVFAAAVFSTAAVPAAAFAAANYNL